MSARRPRTPATTALMIAILAGFVFELVSGAAFDGRKLALYGANLPIDYLLQSGEYWRLLTSMFLHGDGTILIDLAHLGLNLYALYQLGTIYELMFGSRRFVSIYFACGIVASIVSSFHIKGESVGASGAIFGILGAFVFSVWRSPRWRHERMARSLVKQCVFWIVANIAIGLQISMIDNAAHIGGLVTGLLLGAILPQPAPPPTPPNQTVVDVTPTSPSES